MKPKNLRKKLKKDTFKMVFTLFDGKEMVFNSFKKAVFPIRPI